MVYLLTDQIEFADVVLLNKVSDASSAQVDAARKTMSKARVAIVACILRSQKRQQE